jgi:hypothetical protein
MTRTAPTTLMCRNCKATSVERRDPVSSDAAAYTCSCCLLLGRDDVTGQDGWVARRQRG